MRVEMECQMDLSLGCLMATKLLEGVFVEICKVETPHSSLGEKTATAKQRPRFYFGNVNVKTSLRE